MPELDGSFTFRPGRGELAQVKKLAEIIANYRPSYS
jgi:hypothetical protein